MGATKTLLRSVYGPICTAGIGKEWVGTRYFTRTAAQLSGKIFLNCREREISVWTRGKELVSYRQVGAGRPVGQAGYRGAAEAYAFKSRKISHTNAMSGAFKHWLNA
jgi:hypothetical protein